MQLPVSQLDYVIVHELAHIGQPRHTPAFWATVERTLPDYDQRRTRLAVTGTTSGSAEQSCAASVRAGWDTE
jgi:predicted metal-dependent hydrolase